MESRHRYSTSTPLEFGTNYLPICSPHRSVHSTRSSTRHPARQTHTPVCPDPRSRRKNERYKLVAKPIRAKRQKEVQDILRTRQTGKTDAGTTYAYAVRVMYSSKLARILLVRHLFPHMCRQRSTYIGKCTLAGQRSIKRTWDRQSSSFSSSCVEKRKQQSQSHRTIRS